MLPRGESRRCAICAGFADVVRGWCGSQRPVCDRCRVAIVAHAGRTPVRRATAAGRRAWLAEELERRVPRKRTLAGQAA